MKQLRAIAATCGLLSSIVAPIEAGIPRARVGERWALIVSTGSASRTSAQALAQLLKDSYGFGRDAVVLLNDAEATREHIQEAMSRLEARVQPYDAIFVYLSLDKRPDPSGLGGFSFIPAGAATSEPWSWLSARRVLEWLSVLPVGSGMVLFPSCPTKLEEFPIGDLIHGKRPGTLELLRMCDRGSANQTSPSPQRSEQWRAHVLGRVAALLKEIVSRRVSVSAAEMVALLQRSVPEAQWDLRRVPEYIREGFVFEPVARRVASERTRYRFAAQY
jgi:hypothetical protein